MTKDEPHRPSKCTVADTKPPVVTGHDNRYAQATGGRSKPDAPSAPDGISGNWK